MSRRPGGRVDPRELVLYAVTDSSWLAGRSLAACVEQAVGAGASFVQLREKGAGFDEQLARARELLPICRRAGVALVINDRVDVAQASGADGVHIGQGDLSCREARRILGPDAIVGVSAHNVAEALAAEEQGASYLGAGALCPTGTKSDATALAPDELKAMCEAIRIPIVGIGGLNAQTIPRFSGLGLAGAAVVSGIFAADDIARATAELRAICEATFGEAAHSRHEEATRLR